MKQDVITAEVADAEINVWKLIENVKNGWKWLVVGGGVGFLGVFGFVILTPAQYEATAMIQPATIGMIVAATTTTTTTTTTSVEPVTQTLERLKLVTFYNDEILKTCQADSAKGLANSIKAGLVKGNSLLSIMYRADSAALAKACMAKILGKLTQYQAAIAAPLIKELEEQRASTKQQIDEAEHFLAQGEKRATFSAASNEPLTLLILKREELMKLQKLYREQRIQLTEPLTQPMKLLEPIYVSENAEDSKKLIAAIGGLVGGVFAGLLALLVNRSWRCYVQTSFLASRV